MKAQRQYENPSKPKPVVGAVSESNPFLGLDEYVVLLTRLTLKNVAEPVPIALGLDGYTATDLDLGDRP